MGGKIMRDLGRKVGDDATQAGAPPPIMITVMGNRLVERADSFAVDALPRATPRRIVLPDHDLSLAINQTYSRGASPQVDALLGMLTRGYQMAAAGKHDLPPERTQVALLMEEDGRLKGLIFFEQGHPLPMNSEDAVHSATQMTENTR